jgi:nucleotide-binding universal stress UspA family protein
LTIVVGVDGSPGSAAALRWGLAEARLRAMPLRIVHAYQTPQLSVGDIGVGGPGVAFPAAGADDTERLRAAAEAAGRRIIEQTLERVDDQATEGVDVKQELIQGPAASVLIEAARDADLLVVGSRGHGGFVGLLLGSVSQQVAQHPPCPVVILPPAEEDEAGPDE